MRGAAGALALALAGCASPWISGGGSGMGGGGDGEEGGFGAFSGDPVGRFRLDRPWNTFELTAPFVYTAADGTLWTVPAGEWTDGATIPPPFWAAVGGPFEGPYLYAAIIHDRYVGSRERPPAAVHRAFYDGMRASGVEEALAKLMYWAILVFGPPDWGPPGARLAAEARVDLVDPDQFWLSLSKFAAVARTLETTGGAVLDVGPGGPVPGDLASIEAHAREVAAAIVAAGDARGLRAAPGPDLGLGGAWEDVAGGTIRPWPGGVVPDYATLPRLSAAPRAEAFVLDDPGAAARRQGARAPGE